ncbi:hypothetical protein ElyMa_003164200 [Elysia marginata]|uniref:Reverse transcriptase/retrotransposon-derived protein RNase H-like domain-containing protein n=1 Tax=Elysia marginata TaxID=1093978 RepID=A0AAV4IZQ2_9GAST|nr:hypothetical protein ElyMa_003164200 [Elysia marginata]
MWSKEAHWRPNLTISGQPLKYCESPTFLGLTFDRQLTFNHHRPSPPELIFANQLAAPLDIQREIAERTTNELPTPTIQIFTDGSAMDGTDYCGGGVCIKTND